MLPVPIADIDRLSPRRLEMRRPPETLRLSKLMKSLSGLSQRMEIHDEGVQYPCSSLIFFIVAEGGERLINHYTQVASLSDCLQCRCIPCTTGEDAPTRRRLPPLARQMVIRPCL